jgi:uncharacterized protein (TIGR00369 family)
MYRYREALAEACYDAKCTRRRQQAPPKEVAAMPDDQRLPERMRTFTWDDPLPAVRAAARMSGLEVLRAIRDGELPTPPITRLMDFRLAEADEGRVVFVAAVGEYLYNPIGSVHGGFAATLLDSAMGCAINTLLAAGTTYTTLELKVNYVRPITLGSGELRAEGSVIHLGGRVATAEGRITDAAGKLCAHATTTCLLTLRTH